MVCLARVISKSHYLNGLTSGPVRRGTVLASFDPFCYLEFPNRQMVCLGTAAVGNGPFHMVLELPVGLDFLSTVHRGEACFAGRCSLCAETLTAHVADALQWTQSWERDLASRVSRPLMIDALEGIFLEEGSTRSLGWQLAFRPVGNLSNTLHGRFLSKAGESLASLKSGVLSRDFRSVFRGAAELVGLGFGLTPSGD